MSNAAAFDGSFEFLPLRAHIDLGAVPSHPTSDDFHLAVSQLRAAENDSGTITWAIAAARWRVEAIRTRRQTPGAEIADRETFARTATALFNWSRSF